MAEKLIPIRVLVSMAGASFDYQPNDLVEVPEAEAKGWIGSGLAETVPKAEVERQRAAKAEAAAREAGGEIGALQEQLIQKDAIIEKAAEDIASRDKEIEALKAEIETLKSAAAAAAAPAPAEAQAQG